jgi:2-oxoglutarate ferredoxin oxidoreductase subunit alpha
MTIPVSERDPQPRDVATEKLDDVVIRFAGDSGDGMQLTGTQFTTASALAGNDLATFPDYPAEIRAPAGTIAGVSAFQVRIADYDIHTPGDAPDVLVAMNPAALRVNLKDLKQNGVLIVNTDEFDQRNLNRVGYTSNPLEDESLNAYRLFKVDITRLTKETLKDSGLDTKSQERCKNFFALGMTYWLFSKPLDSTIEWLQEKFKSKPKLAEANTKVLKAGWNFCDITELFQVRYEIEAAKLQPGTYRNVMGNQAIALGAIAASRRSGLPLFQGAYPITPASDVLHDLSYYKQYGVTTYQAEDEIAAMCATVGAAYAGSLAFTSTSGPGMALKTEAIGLAIITELPMLIVNVQRGGPSTGLPTKTEQADLFQAVLGRNGEAPLPVLAASSPGDCFDAMLDGFRIALKYMTPVILLSDGYIANGSEPWQVPKVEDLPDLRKEFATDPTTFKPYDRDAATLARPWAIPGTPGLEHRIGGLEKANVTGHVSYDPSNHEEMIKLRAEKTAREARDIPDVVVDGEPEGNLLVIGWGSTAGAITGAVKLARREGLKVSRVHLRWLNPFPKNLGEVLSRFDKVLVPEMNLGQLAFLLKANYLKPVISFPKVQGKPYYRFEILDEIRKLQEAKTHVH